MRVIRDFTVQRDGDPVALFGCRGGVETPMGARVRGGERGSPVIAT